MKRLLVMAAVSCSIMAGGASTALAKSAPPLLPTSSDQCKQGGWETYGVFKNQGDCVSFVETDGSNQPAG